MNNRVLKNASWIIVCRVIQSLLALIIGTLTARYLGPSNYGLINYASSIVAFVIPIMQLGFRNTMVNELIKTPDEEERILGTILLMNLTSAVFCIIGVVSFVSIVNKEESETIIVCTLYSLNLLFQALEMVQYWFQARLLSKYTALVSVMAYAVVSAYKAYLLISGKNIYWFAVSQCIEHMVISVSLLIIYWRIEKKKMSFSLLKGREMFSNSRHYIVSSMMVAVFGYIGNIFLKFMVDERAVGYYTAAVTCAGITSFIFSAIIDSFRPIIFERNRTDSVECEKKIVQLYTLIIVLTFLQSIFISIFAEVIIKILFGTEYMEAIVPLKIYTWQTVFSQIGTIRNIWILAESKQQYLWLINFVGAIFNIAVNIILIPTMGVVGAAISAVITQLFTNVILGYILKPIRRNNILLVKSMDLRKTGIIITRMISILRHGK